MDSQPSAVAKATMAALWALVLAACAVAVGAFLWVALSRMAYPFELEWMEGNSVDHVQRLFDGKDIYVAPSTEHVALLYTPLYYYLSYVTASFTGLGLFPLRLTSFLCALGCGVVLGWKIQRETGSWRSAAVAAGAFFAGYGLVDTWFDLARNDTTFVFFMVAAGSLLLTPQRKNPTRLGMATTVLAIAAVCLAYLSKQTALALLPGLFLAAAILDWRRALVFGLVSGAIMGALTVTYNLATDGWFYYFVFTVLQGHTLDPKMATLFWTDDAVVFIPSLVVAAWYIVVTWRTPKRRRTIAMALFAAALFGTAYSGRLHSGGHSNALIPALAALGLTLGLATANPDTAPARNPVARAIVLLLVLCQFGLLAYDPRDFQPTPRHRAAFTELTQQVRDAPGNVYVPFHTHVQRAAGKPALAHAMAVWDVMRSNTQRGIDALGKTLGPDLQNGRFAVVILDDNYAHTYMQYMKGYVEREGSPVEDPEGLWPVTGYRTRPVRVFDYTR